MYAVVLGSSGAVGREVVNQFITEGHSVLSVDMFPLSKEQGESSDFLQLDLSKELPRRLLDTIGGVADVVVNCAACLTLNAPKNVLYKINVNLPHQVFKTLLRSQSDAHFIHISSASIYRASNSIISETFPLEGNSNYEQSKIESEKELFRLATLYKGRVTYSILRPSLIYGPRTKHLGATLAAIPSLLRPISDKGILIPGFCGGPKTNFVHVEDVARAAFHLAQAWDQWEIASNEIYNICDDTPLPFGDMIQAHLNKGGVKTLGKIPLTSPNINKLFKPVLENLPIMDGLDMILGKVWKNHCTRNNLRTNLRVELDKSMSSYLYQDTIFSNDKLKGLGFQLKYPSPLDNGVLEKTLEFYKKERWI